MSSRNIPRSDGSLLSNENEDPENPGNDNPIVIRSTFRALVQDFDPIWFTWCMNSGIIAILLDRFPYQFPGIGVLSTIAFLIDFVLFIIFSILFILRFAWFRAAAFNELVDDIASLGLTACWPIAFQTLVAFVALTVGNAHWGGHAFTIVAYVMWWFGTVWMVAELLLVFLILINRKELGDRQIPPTIYISVVGIGTSAVVGGNLASFAYGISAQLAVPVIIFAFCVAGIGLTFAILLHAYLFHQLLRHGWPPADQTPLLFIYIGPLGQSASAFQALGSAANTYGNFAGYNSGTFLTSTAAAPLSVVCTLFGILLTGISSFWAIMAFYAMFSGLLRRQIPWSPSWNSLIFSSGTLATSMELLSISLDSPFFRVMTGIFLVFFIIVFFTNLGFTLFEIFKGRLLIVRRDPRVKESLE